MFSRRRFARTFSRCSRPPICSRPRSPPSTGKKVNSALDNPTNYFTAASLDSRASDINNLLDSIGNGVQVLQSANTGITSLQKLVDSAKSVANQALQTTVGYSTKSAFTSVEIEAQRPTISSPIRIRSALLSSVLLLRSALPIPAPRLTAGTQLETAGPVNATAATLLSDLTRSGRCCRHVHCQRQDDHLRSWLEWPRRSGNAYTLGVDTSLTISSTAIDTLSGNTTPANASTATGGIIQLNSGTAADLVVPVPRLPSSASPRNGTNWATRTGGAVTAGALAGTTKLGVRRRTAASLSNGFAVGDTLTVNGKTLTFVAANTVGNDPNQIKIDSDVTGLLAKIDGLTGSSTASTITGGKITLNTGTLSDLSITSSNAGGSHRARSGWRRDAGTHATRAYSTARP